jgi:hypothetical protein
VTGTVAARAALHPRPRCGSGAADRRATRVELAAAVVGDRDRLVAVLSLPSDTRRRVARSLRSLRDFPLLGAELGCTWSGMRFLLGPWRWMLLVYEYIEADDRVVVVMLQDARSCGHHERIVPGRGLSPEEHRGVACYRRERCATATGGA